MLWRGEVCFATWLPRAAGMLDAAGCVIGEGRFSEAAFDLHKVTEPLYHPVF